MKPDCPVMRMRIIYVLVCILFGLSGQGLKAQQSFFYGPYEIDPPGNVWKLKGKNKNVSDELGEPVENAYYVLGQFKTNPSACERDEYAMHGLRLLHYIGYQTYYVRIDTARVKDAIGASNLVSLFPADWRWKCDLAIANDELPQELMREDGSVGVIVIPFEGYPAEWIQAKLLTMNIESKHVFMHQPFNTFALWLPREKIIELAEQGWVRHVTLAGPEVVR